MNDTQTNELRDALESQRKEVLYDVSRHAAKGIGVGVIADETERADKIAENMVEHVLSYSESKLPIRLAGIWECTGNPTH